jgi:hypothetical protein
MKYWIRGSYHSVCEDWLVLWDVCGPVDIHWCCEGKLVNIYRTARQSHPRRWTSLTVAPDPSELQVSNIHALLSAILHASVVAHGSELVRLFGFMRKYNSWSMETCFGSSGSSKGHKNAHFFELWEMKPVIQWSVDSQKLNCETQTNQLRGFSPRANYTDRATAACRQS